MRLWWMQFYEVDLPQVSQKKIDLVDAVIPDKEKVSHLVKPCFGVRNVPPSVQGFDKGTVEGLHQCTESPSAQPRMRSSG